MPAPWAADALLVLLRWLHGLATIGFLGWTLVYLLEPVDQGQNPENEQRVRRYKDMSDVTLLVFLASGAILSFDRLSHGAGALYAGILALKVLLSVGAYQFAFQWRRRRLVTTTSGVRSAYAALASGILVVLLAAVLKGVFEGGLRSQF